MHDFKWSSLSEWLPSGAYFSRRSEYSKATGSDVAVNYFQSRSRWKLVPCMVCAHIAPANWANIPVSVLLFSSALTSLIPISAGATIYPAITAITVRNAGWNSLRKLPPRNGRRRKNIFRYFTLSIRAELFQWRPPHTFQHSTAVIFSEFCGHVKSWCS